ncbi:MAG: two-component regulator propeller domain-containing protein [Candidatus Heimdallarchaeota archaeon]
MKRFAYSGSLALTLASIIAAVVFLFPVTAQPQNPEWMNFTIKNTGLPDNDVRALVIDAHGNTWIGTWGGGLVRFDGVNWTIANTGNSGIPSNDVTALAIDPHGNIWVGTDYGLAKFDLVTWKVANTYNSVLPDNDVRALATDAQGNIWIGTYWGGLAKFDGSSWTAYTRWNSGLPNDNIAALTIGDPGGISGLELGEVAWRSLTALTGRCITPLTPGCWMTMSRLLP